MLQIVRIDAIVDNSILVELVVTNLHEALKSAVGSVLSLTAGPANPACMVMILAVIDEELPTMHSLVVHVVLTLLHTTGAKLLLRAS